MEQTESGDKQLHSRILKEVLSNCGSKVKILQCQQSGTWKLMQNLRTLTKVTQAMAPYS